MIKAKIDKEKLLKKFKTLSVTSICIQKTSKYLYQFYKSSDIIVNVWLEALNTVNSDSARIALFYIANEILQSKNYGSSYFKQSWKPHLVHSIDSIKESSVNDKIRRILNIWVERNVFEKSFVDELINRLATSKSPLINDELSKDIIMNFDPDEAMEKLKELITVEKKTTDTLKEHEPEITFDEKLCKEQIKKLKDKNHCNQFSGQLDGNVKHLFQVCTVLEEELKIRQKAIDVMTNADIYYDTQKKETLIVEDAYRRYGNLILKTKEAIEEHIDFLMDGGSSGDIDDAPSPGNTPLYFYETTSKTISNDLPLSDEDIVSPSQSMDMSEDDTPMDKSSYLDKPYSPSHQIQNIKSTNSESKVPLSRSDALKILSSFSQSLTKISASDVNAKVNLQSDIFRNTLTTPIKLSSDDERQTDKTEKSTAFADAFRLISNLTGLKNINERKSDPSIISGTNIPILTSTSSFQSIDLSNENPKSIPFNLSNFTSSTNKTDTDSQHQLMNPNIQLSSLFPPPNNTSISPHMIQSLFNSSSLASAMDSSNQHKVPNSRSPSSCTDDDEDGGDTPTQDEPALLNATIPPPMFNANMLPAISSSAESISKQIQNAINSGPNPFGQPNMLTMPLDPNLPPWAQMPVPFPFPMPNNLNNVTSLPMPFPMLIPGTQIQAMFNPSCNSTPMFVGPPRAIRTKRPNADSSQTALNQSMNDINDEIALHNIHSQSPPPPPPPERAPSVTESMLSDKSIEQIEPTMPSNNSSKHNDTVESDIINLYGDVEEELDRNYNCYQQSLNNGRNCRPPVPADRYHLYNNQADPHATTDHYRPYNDAHHQSLAPVHHQPPPPFQSRPRMATYPRHQFQTRGTHNMSYYPNRTTTFRPKNNYNMFN